ncbi:hypothetical protein ACFPZ0_17185 [Streptomonospora nanhaiensis]|uniref:Uncharacterized protein n=1 Tax=Streptomonospora nanhaiensis TaxID=1323731 RepID=A0A853BPY8_9ACTN|nr:hypothetical protein [Streptomonospora nanhaiensis]MBV2363854.1 hypothetical protein [Streptomonospora nanhaiensis]MBX9389876.1 hypothetical protein [Streptomonospora nanhaiensis]NYI96844.1 hypothetical protein [Streptomonospora nanhaiensis]
MTTKPAPAPPADDNPLVLADDRFATGLPGRCVPVSDALPSAHRPWGMDRARVPRPVRLPTGKHQKPTENKIITRPTTINNGGKVESDTETQTVTD